ncbi:hypothetical protein [Stutzerimonas stutzeri]|uniref:Uncharacterized protein n=1 Tax=Stutzerimonas stutzeri TaxID=316 RepID=A0A5S5BM08_STUST|nr:hypothetical protein [Stutzerimonas stutzeri]TYP67306.1 hypothetical protein A9A72_10212 [Stutzerimonas stutzeri]
MKLLEIKQINRLRDYMRKTEIAINKKSPGMFKNYFESIRSNNGITISIALAGLAYTCAITIGSGSYLEFFGGHWLFGFFVKSLLVFSAIFFAWASGFSIFVYMLHITLIDKMDDKLKVERLLFIRDFGIFGVLFSILLVFFLLFLGCLGVNIVFIDIMVAATFLFIAGFTIIAMVSYFTYDILQMGWRQFFTLLLALFLSSMLYLNAYRDAEKSAKITDGKYCYWLKKSATPTEYKNDPTCN